MHFQWCSRAHPFLNYGELVSTERETELVKDEEYGAGENLISLFEKAFYLTQWILWNTTNSVGQRKNKLPLNRPNIDFFFRQKGNSSLVDSEFYVALDDDEERSINDISNEESLNSDKSKSRSFKERPWMRVNKPAVNCDWKPTKLTKERCNHFQKTEYDIQTADEPDKNNNETSEEAYEIISKIKNKLTKSDILKSEQKENKKRDVDERDLQSPNKEYDVAGASLEEVNKGPRDTEKSTAGSNIVKSYINRRFKLKDKTKVVSTVDNKKTSSLNNDQELQIDLSSKSDSVSQEKAKLNEMPNNDASVTVSKAEVTDPTPGVPEVDPVEQLNQIPMMIVTLSTTVTSHDVESKVSHDLAPGLLQGNETLHKSVRFSQITETGEASERNTATLNQENQHLNMYHTTSSSSTEPPPDAVVDLMSIGMTREQPISAKDDLSKIFARPPIKGASQGNKKFALNQPIAEKPDTLAIKNVVVENLDDSQEAQTNNIVATSSGTLEVRSVSVESYAQVTPLPSHKLLKKSADNSQGIPNTKRIINGSLKTKVKNKRNLYKMFKKKRNKKRQEMSRVPVGQESSVQLMQQEYNQLEEQTTQDHFKDDDYNYLNEYIDGISNIDSYHEASPKRYKGQSLNSKLPLQEMNDTQQEETKFASQNYQNYDDLFAHPLRLDDPELNIVRTDSEKEHFYRVIPWRRKIKMRRMP